MSALRLMGPAAGAIRAVRAAGAIAAVCVAGAIAAVRAARAIAAVRAAGVSAAIAVTAVTAATFSPAAVAQSAKNGDAFVPGRLWDGKTPDFRGIWQAQGTAYVNIEGHPGENGLAPSPSIIVDPPNGKIPYTREALERRDDHYRNRAVADPSSKCYQAGVPRATYLPTPLQILQSPGNFAIVYQDNHAFRVFHPDARPHFDAADWWMGDTRYRWEGDTLVADVAALTDQLWFDQAGNFHSTSVHIVERYRMTGPDTLEYEARIEDPEVYTAPWTLRTVLHRVKEPGARIIEDECLEDENGVRHHISPYDPANLLEHDYSGAGDGGQ